MHPVPESSYAPLCPDTCIVPLVMVNHSFIYDKSKGIRFHQVKMNYERNTIHMEPVPSMGTYQGTYRHEAMKVNYMHSTATMQRSNTVGVLRSIMDCTLKYKMKCRAKSIRAYKAQMRMYSISSGGYIVHHGTDLDDLLDLSLQYTKHTTR